MNTVDNPQAPADLEWLESRGWTVVTFPISGTRGASWPLPQIGPYHRRININREGCSITSTTDEKAERYLREGIRLADLPRAISLSLPVCTGWPSRELVVTLEHFASLL